MWNELNIDQLHREFDNLYNKDNKRKFWTLSSGICIENGCGIGSSVNYHIGDLNIFIKPVKDQAGNVTNRFFWMISGTGPVEGYWEDYSSDTGIRNNLQGYNNFQEALSDLFSYLQMKKENTA